MSMAAVNDFPGLPGSFYEVGEFEPDRFSLRVEGSCISPSPYYERECSFFQVFRIAPAKDGTFTIPSFQIPSVDGPVIRDFFVKIFILYPDGSEELADKFHLGRIDSSGKETSNSLPRRLDYTSLQIRQDIARLKLPDGRDVVDWINRDAPGGELTANLSLRYKKYSDSPEAELKYKMTGLRRAHVSLPGSFLLVNQPLSAVGNLDLNVTIYTVFGSPLFAFHGKVPFNSSVFEAIRELPLDISSVNSDALNSNSGGTISLFEYSENPADAEVTAQLRCRNQSLEGSISVLFKNRRWDEMTESLSVRGECDQVGRGTFSVRVKVRRFEDQKYTEMPLIFILDSGSGHIRVTVLNDQKSIIGEGRLRVNGG